MKSDVSHLPHPLAILRIRAENEKSPRGRHDAAYLLWEAGLRLLAAVLLAEYQDRPQSCPNLIQPLGGLRGPSTGHWRAIVRELLPVLAAGEDDPALATVAHRLSPRRTVRDMPHAALLAHALATKLRPERATQPQQTVRLANLFDDMVTYRHEVRAHGGLGDDNFFNEISLLMLAGLDEIFAGVDVLCGCKLVRSNQPESSSMLGSVVPDSSGTQPNDFTELTIRSAETSLPISPWVYWNEAHGEMSFFNGFGGGHQKQAMYLTYVSGAKTKQSSQSLVELIGKLHSAASSDSADSSSFDWIPDYDELEFESEETPIKQIGDYKILEEIGQGGMGTVYRAFQPSLQRMVAMKVMRDPHDSVSVARFDREIQSLAKVDHPNLVKIYDSGTSGDDYFYTMELVEGNNLSVLSKSDSDDAPVYSHSREVRRISRLMKQVANATEVLNQNGVIHRDIKPANIMVNSAGDRAVLLDLGLAHQVDSQGDLTRTEQFVGTLRYSSPEQLLATVNLDARSDVYSLGVTFWELLTLRPMFGGDESLSTPELMLRIQSVDPVSPRKHNPQVPRDLEAIVLKCLEKDRNRRYASAAALADDLARWDRGESVTARRATVTYHLAKKVRKHRMRLAMAAMLLLFTAVGVSFAMHSLREQGQEFAAAAKKEQTRNAVSRLLEGSVQQVPARTKALVPYSTFTKNLLETEFDESKTRADFKRQLNAALALIRDDPALLGFLQETLLRSEIEELPVIRAALTKYREEVIPNLWNSLDSELPAEERFRAAVVLAGLTEPSDLKTQHWNRHMPMIADHAMREIRLDVTKLEPLINELAPISDQLDVELRLRLSDPSESLRETASRILLAIRSNDPQQLINLALKVPGDFERKLVTKNLQPHTAVAIPELRKRLAVDLEAFDSIPAEIVQQIEGSDGTITEQYAFVHTLELNRFAGLADALSKVGYRPVRLRPYESPTGVLTAAVWHRDSKPWSVRFGTSKTIEEENRTRLKAGFVPVDVAGYVATHDGNRIERYACLWGKREERLSRGTRFQILIGMSSEDFVEQKNRVQAQGYMPLTVQHFFGSNDVRYSSVWKSDERGWKAEMLIDQTLDQIQNAANALSHLTDLDSKVIPLDIDRTAYWKQTLKEANVLLEKNNGDLNAYSRAIAANYNLEDWGTVLELARLSSKTHESIAASKLYWLTTAYARLGEEVAAEESLQRYVGHPDGAKENVPYLKGLLVIFKSGSLSSEFGDLIAGKELTEADDYNGACLLSLASERFNKNEPETAKQFRDQAFERLNHLVDEGYREVLHLQTDIDMNPLRSDPRFLEVLQRANQPTYALIKLNDEKTENRRSILEVFAPNQSAVVKKPDYQNSVPQSVTVHADQRTNGAALLWQNLSNTQAKNWKNRRSQAWAMHKATTSLALQQLVPDVARWPEHWELAGTNQFVVDQLLESFPSYEKWLYDTRSENDIYDAQFWMTLEQIKVEDLDWENTEGDARTWWLAFEQENKTKPALMAKIAYEIKDRASTIEEFFLAYIHSDTADVTATLSFLSYSKARDRGKDDPLIGYSTSDESAPAEAMAAQLEEKLQVSNASEVARAWWYLLRQNHRDQLALVFQFVDDVAKRDVTLEQFYRMTLAAETENLKARLFYLDYQLRKEELLPAESEPVAKESSPPDSLPVRTSVWRDGIELAVDTSDDITLREFIKRYVLQTPKDRINVGVTLNGKTVEDDQQELSLSALMPFEFRIETADRTEFQLESHERAVEYIANLSDRCKELTLAFSSKPENKIDLNALAELTDDLTALIQWYSTILSMHSEVWSNHLPKINTFAERMKQFLESITLIDISQSSLDDLTEIVDDLSIEINTNNGAAKVLYGQPSNKEVLAALATKYSLVRLTVAEKLIDKEPDMIEGWLTLVEILENPEINRTKIGIGGDDDKEADGGITVHNVVPTSCAANAGIREGDVLTHFAGKPIGNFGAFTAMVAEASVGQQLQIKLLRDGKAIEASVYFGSSRNSLVPILIDGLKRESPKIQQLAVTGLGLIGPDAKDAIDHLRTLKKAASKELSKEIDRTLQKIANSRSEK